MIRRQLPALSPLSATGIARALARAIRSPEASRAALRSHLRVRFGAERALLTGSGTQALQLALQAAPSLRPGANGCAALPAYSCYDVLTAALGAGVRVRFYDVDPSTLTPDGESLRRVLAAGASVVVVPNLCGYPVDWEAVRAEVSDAGALLIEDAAQALGSSWRRVEGGSFGDLTVLSFGRGKGWTGGGGGALLIRAQSDAALGELPSPGPIAPPSGSAGARAAALSWVQWAIGRPSSYWLATGLPGTGLGETHFKTPVDPRGMPAFCAATVLEHAEVSEAMGPTRRRWAAAWEAAIESFGTESPVRPCVPLDREACGFLRLAALCEAGTDVEGLVTELRTAGVARAYPKALPALAAAAAVADGAPQVPPGARELASRLVTFPTHLFVSELDIERAVPRMKAFPRRPRPD